MWKKITTADIQMGRDGEIRAWNAEMSQNIRRAVPPIFGVFIAAASVFIYGSQLPPNTSEFESRNDHGRFPACHNISSPSPWVAAGRIITQKFKGNPPANDFYCQIDERRVAQDGTLYGGGAVRVYIDKDNKGNVTARVGSPKGPTL